MQDIIVEKPYKFISPHRGDWIPSFIQRFKLVDAYLSYFEGVASHEVRGIENLTDSIQRGRGIILSPNHCRYADPLTMVWIARQAKVHVYAMASWHLFHQNRLQAFAMRLCGGFSVYREGVDRVSLDTAIDIVGRAERPLILFPEGTVFRANDRLMPLMDGVSFLARAAAKRRKRDCDGEVVIHPVAIKYVFRGDIEATVEPVVQRLEKGLTWHETLPRHDLVGRLERLSEGLLTVKEVQYLGRAQTGSLSERKTRLVDCILHPIEEDLLGRRQDGDLVPRIKQLRAKLVPRLIAAADPSSERDQIWNQLEAIYSAQIVEAYPEGYLDDPTETRLLETAERLDEDVNDHAQVHRPLHAILQVGKAIVADPKKPAKGTVDPIMEDLESQLKSMLGELAHESPAYQR
ncbi:MAG: 1-acyl-sn-glycerol-3-phosphate acyltransferase [Pirellulaceae bacterium]